MSTSKSAAAPGRPPAPEVARLADRIAAVLREKPLQFMDLVRAHRDLPYRTLLLAWGVVRERETLARDDEGHYFIARKG
jgi:hypothetical protein